METIFGRIGRVGEGPGEFRSPCALMVLPDNTICVLQSVPVRAVLLTAEGDAAGDHPLPKGKDGGTLYLNGGAIGNGALVLCVSEFMQAESSFSLETSFVKIDEAGAVVRQLLEPAPYGGHGQRNTRREGRRRARWVVGNGRMAVLE